MVDKANIAPLAPFTLMLSPKFVHDVEVICPQCSSYCQYLRSHWGCRSCRLVYSPAAKVCYDARDVCK